jgi:hypothetical protein
MQQNKTCIERAFELAKSGEYPTVGDIRKQLKAEHFDCAQVADRSISKQLKSLIIDAMAKTGSTSA